MLSQTPAEKWLRGPVGFLVVSTLHLALIYLIATGLTRVMPGIQDEPPVVHVITEENRIIDDFPDRPVDTRDWVPVTPPDKNRDIVEDDPADTSQLAVPDTSGGAVSQAGAGSVTPTAVAPRIDPRRPLSQPDYPSADIRLEHEGRVLLRLRVGPDGRVLAAEVARSSGFASLDQAAVRAALQDWRLLPARQGDAAVEGVFSTWVRFDLSDR